MALGCLTLQKSQSDATTHDCIISYITMNSIWCAQATQKLGPPMTIAPMTVISVTRHRNYTSHVLPYLPSLALSHNSTSPKRSEIYTLSGLVAGWLQTVWRYVM